MNSYSDISSISDQVPEVNPSLDPSLFPLTEPFPSYGQENSFIYEKSTVEKDGTGFAPGGGGAGTSLSNTVCNSNESDKKDEKHSRQRSWSEVKKRRHIVKWEVRENIHQSEGLNHWVFLTFTTPDNCTDKKEFERRINNMVTGLMRKECGGRYVMARERQKRGAWHIHVIAYAGKDVRAGTKWGEVYNRYKKRNEMVVVHPGPGLKPWFELCRKVREKYEGMGRCSAEPAGKNQDKVESAAGYLCKYVTKEIGEIGTRAISYGRNWSRATTSRIMMLNERTARWRAACSLKYEHLATTYPGISKQMVWQFILDQLKAIRQVGGSVRDFLEGMESQHVFQKAESVRGDLFEDDLRRDIFEGHFACGRFYVPVPFMMQEPGKHFGYQWAHVVHRNGIKPRDNPYEWNTDGPACAVG